MLTNSVLMFTWWPTRRSGAERRRRPRIPLAIPIRYATDQGQVGIGVLIDVHEEGAGLLVPDLAPETFHVWLQFLWFDDRMGLQGRVAFTRETPDGIHAGLDLQHVHSESEQFLARLVIPYGLHKFRLDRRRAGSLLHALSPSSLGAWHERRRRFLPVLVEQGSVKVWAITEDRSDHGAVLLTPQALRGKEPLTMTTWRPKTTRRRPDTRTAKATQSELLKLAAIELHRTVVHFEEAPAARPRRARVGSPVVR